jgi:hypothetical protein
MDEPGLTRDEAVTLLASVEDIGATLARLERLDPTLSRRKLTANDLAARESAAANARRLRKLLEAAGE